MAFKKPRKAAPPAPIENGRIAVMAPVDLTIDTFHLNVTDWEAMPVVCQAALQEAAGLLTDRPLTHLYVATYSHDGQEIMDLISASDHEAAISMFVRRHEEISNIDEWSGEPLVLMVPSNAVHNYNVGHVPWARIV